MLMLISKKVKMYQLWDNYRKTLFSVFPDLEYGDTWARWEGKGTSLIARLTQIQTSSKQEKLIYGVISLASITTSSIQRQVVIYLVLVWT